MRVHGIKISDYYTGLSNQLIQLFHGIIVCICKSVDVVVVDDFKADIYTGNYCPVEDVLDMDKLCTYFYNHYGVAVVGKTQFQLEIVRAEYGTMTCFVNVRDVFVEKFLHHDRLFVPPGIILNSLMGDPAKDRRKSLRITYKIREGLEIMKCYTEESMVLDCHYKNIVFHQHPHWPEQIKWLETMIRCFSFHEKFYHHHPCLEQHHTVHVVHVRLEYDATRHWARENKMEETTFYNLLAKKYISAIQQHMTNGIIMILSYHRDNRVVDWLVENKMPHIFLEKDASKGREWNAAHDMAMAEKYANGVFIGNFDLYRMQGSTFSYFVMKKARFQKHVLIDIERIHEEPMIL